MSDILTRIGIPGARNGWGLMDWGRLSATEMIAQYRAHIDHLREQVALADATPDEGFQIDVIRGNCVQHHVATVQSPPNRQSR